MKTGLWYQNWLSGFRAVLPFWLSAIPFGITYALTARQVGFSLLETQLMSLLVFSSTAQLTLVSLVATGASGLLLLLTSLVLTVHQLLYGVSLSRLINFSGRQKLLAAYFMTDAAYGLTIARGKAASFAFLLGAEISMFVGWNAGTLVGGLLDQNFIDPTRLGLDFIVPLTFWVVLVTMLRGHSEIEVALVAGLGAVAVSFFWSGGGLILVVGLVGASFGAWRTSGKT